jgi:hypothetical protein
MGKSVSNKEKNSKATMKQKTIKGGLFGVNLREAATAASGSAIGKAIEGTRFATDFYEYLKKPKPNTIDAEKIRKITVGLDRYSIEQIIASFPPVEQQPEVFIKYEPFVIDTLITYLTNKNQGGEFTTIITNLNTARDTKAANEKNEKLKNDLAEFSKANPDYNEFDFLLEMFKIYRLNTPNDARYKEIIDKEKYDSDEKYRLYIQKLLIEKYRKSIGIIDQYFTDILYRNKKNIELRNRVYVDEVKRYLAKDRMAFSGKPTVNGMGSFRVFSDGKFDPAIYNDFKYKNDIINRLKILHTRDEAINLISEINILRRTLGSTGRVGESVNAPQSELGAWGTWGAQLIGTSNIEIEKLDETRFSLLSDAKTYLDLLTQTRDELKETLKQTMPQQQTSIPAQQPNTALPAAGGSKKRKNKKGANKTKTQKKKA